MAPKVLIIDDDPICLKVMVAGLKKHGYDVMSSDHPANGFKLAVKNPPNVIIVDVLMPVITGYELAKLFKKLKELRDVPVIIMSAKDAMKEYFDSIHAEYFVQKGDFADLLEKVGLALASAKRRPVEPEQPIASTAGVNGVLLAGMDMYAMGKVKEFLETKHYSVHVTSQDKEAVDYIFQSRPVCVLVQYWENKEVFDATKILSAVSEAQTVQEIYSTVFCTKGVSIDAAQATGLKNIISYEDSKELIRGINLQFLVSLPTD
ncbi:MAG: response regulator [Candidatus Omnitrophica bacterium]|nr:response regulator [Candidatus Omnitrophota bacterium]